MRLRDRKSPHTRTIMEVKKRYRRPKLTLEKIRQEFEKEGLTLLEKEYRGTKQMLKYRCKCKKTRYICYNNFYRGTRCKLCYLQQFANPERDQKYILKIQTRELHFTVTDAARIIGVNYDEFRNAILDGLLPAPTHRIPGSIKFHFNEADIEKTRVVKGQYADFRIINDFFLYNTISRG